MYWSWLWCVGFSKLPGGYVIRNTTSLETQRDFNDLELNCFHFYKSSDYVRTKKPWGYLQCVIVRFSHTGINQTLVYALYSTSAALTMTLSSQVRGQVASKKNNCDCVVCGFILTSHHEMPEQTHLSWHRCVMGSGVNTVAALYCLIIQSDYFFTSCYCSYNPPLCSTVKSVLLHIFLAEVLSNWRYEKADNPQALK